MQHLAAVWTALTVQRRIIVVVATLTMFGAVLALSKAATAPSMALLYSGLEAGAAGEVVAALEQRGIPYEVRGGAIHVDGAQRDELRMSLAAEGLPANGTAGYELLDSLSGFGTTAQMFDAAYWRAKEGELARTIAASPSIRSARVHIASSVNQGFRRDIRPSASVALVPAGQGITPQQARAVRFLVASAVAGLAPEEVSVIDAESGLVLGAEDQVIPAGDPDRARELKRNVERLLQARVGPGRAVVELSIDAVTEREAITERRFDPEGRVAISTESEERTDKSDDTRPGSVTVASNLPQGDGTAGDGRSSSQASETRERVNYEVSETQREVIRAPGGIRRLTVAVLVDGLRGTDASGEPSWQPRPEEEMQSLRDLVASAVGYDEARGDVITLKSMPFEPVGIEGTDSSGAALEIDWLSAGQILVLAVVALVLGLFVLRPILSPRQSVPALAAPGRGPVALASPAGKSLFEMGGTGSGDHVFEGEVDDASDFFNGGFPAVNPALPAMPGQGAGGATFDDADPVSRLRRLIAERKEETVEILRNWMDEREEKT